MNAETIAKALGGRRIGASWMAPCPAHDDREPSLSIRDARGTVLLHCHAGCDQHRVIEALRARGLWTEVSRPHSTVAQGCRSPVRDDRIDEEERRARALRIWDSSKSASGTLVETYLASRGLTLPPPERLRFHPRLTHPVGGAWPAMVALITAGEHDQPIGIHRTFLAPDGRSKAPVTPQKMMLGPCRGGEVRLGAVGEVLLIGEGIETCLSAMQATARPAWAALSTSGLKSLILPEGVNEVILLADGDDAGEVAARACARHLQRRNRRVRIARPPAGTDFNDLLVPGASRIEDDLQ